MEGLGSGGSLAEWLGAGLHPITQGKRDGWMVPSRAGSSEGWPGEAPEAGRVAWLMGAGLAWRGRQAGAWVGRLGL